MIQGIPRSLTGLALSAFIGTAQVVPVFAQPTPSVSPAETPLPPAPATSAAPTLPTQAAGAYTLGAGDAVRIDSFDTPELVLEPRYSVLLDGTVNLPWVGSVPVQGMTLAEASEAISAKYKRFIRNPIVTVSLMAPRPLKIGVIGQVNRPGSYIINLIGNESTQASLSQRSGGEGGTQWPTVSKAIQTAGGITQAANVRQIQVRRPAQSGTEETINVDLWKFLTQGDLSQDMLLRDGDTLVIPLATTLDAAEATQIAGSNFSPEAIKVSVVGEVVAPGAVTVKPNTTLNQAILSAGGLRSNRARRSNVELIRLNPNGTVTRRMIALDLSQGLNEGNNPALRDNDVVVVNRTAFASASDFLSVVLSPLSGVLGLFTVLGNLGR
ncbi:polysaccharide biosynthesis/export family protein [Leptolyngbya sp. FACHB-36]|uniref:polysaccharide biosynthesis/export family protein n=1 Tax=Leptolyngbya sp. FACHB-36 TaxID=2692808 RepID=UPI0016812872|nr:polysaccharide biosynthesis/export family protein [Leptolyngbya sp. FACHB-36]MBD2022172.1 polysaccharide biosynthesis/export family protein [Leptolyngbya sp. FACHB-36]